MQASCAWHWWRQKGEASVCKLAVLGTGGVKRERLVYAS